MAPAQMALPVDRRNGASAHRPAVVAPRVEAEAPAVKKDGQLINVDPAIVVPRWCPCGSGG